MKTIMAAYMLDTEGIMIIWAIALFIFIIMCLTYVVSNRVKDTEENFMRNIKIGAARTIGGLLTFFYIWVTILTIFFFIRKI